MEVMDNVRDYVNYIRSIAIKSSVIKNAWDIKVYAISRKIAVIRARNPNLEFSDGATLGFSEHIEILSDGSVIRKSYSYHYESKENNFFFRYDKDPKACFDRNNNYRFHHAENHLHVNQKSPRYITHATSFDEVLGFIVACYYSD